jgi:hypothetical protein
VEISGSRSKDVPGKKHEISCEKQTKNEKEVDSSGGALLSKLKALSSTTVFCHKCTQKSALFFNEDVLHFVCI